MNSLDSNKTKKISIYDINTTIRQEKRGQFNYIQKSRREKIKQA
jgi:hypothetical protein